MSMPSSPLLNSVIERQVKAFLDWYIAECTRQGVPCDCVAYDIPDAYADWVESLR